MLDDRQLENLIRMAAEIEAMDALASQRQPLHLTGEPARAGAAHASQGRWGLGRGWGAALATVAMAAAASIALIFVPGGLLTASSGSKSSPGGGAGPSGGMVAAVAAPTPSDPVLWSGTGAGWPGALPWPYNNKPVADIRGVLLAIIEDDAGHIECVQWAEHDWDHQGRTLADMKASDMVALSLMMTYDRSPRQMTLVGLTGPADELPLGDARAAELASCIMKAPARCSQQTCCNDGAAAECIPDDVSVRFERFSLR